MYLKVLGPLMMLGCLRREEAVWCHSKENSPQFEASKF